MFSYLHLRYLKEVRLPGSSWGIKSFKNEQQKPLKNTWEDDPFLLKYGSLFCDEVYLYRYIYFINMFFNIIEIQVKLAQARGLIPLLKWPLFRGDSLVFFVFFPVNGEELNPTLLHRKK